MPTILELFQNNQTLSNQVKPDKRTLVDTELKGIRVKSLVDVNNPLIYGNQATRIALRSTPVLDTMKENTSGTLDGGLIGSQITKARNFVNDKLGIPSAQIPTKVSDKVIELRASDDDKKTSQDPVDIDFMGQNGTGLGKFLKQTGGGNPTTIGKQAIGGAISFAKDKIRETLFGSSTSGEATGKFPGKDKVTFTSNDVKYSDRVDIENLKKNTKEDIAETKLDLSKVSPIYGISREGDFEGRFGNTSNAYQYLGPDLRKNEILPKYTPKENENYSSDDNRKEVKDSRKDEGTFAGKSLDERGVGRKEKNIIGLQSPQDDIKIDENNVITKDGSEYKDLVPFHITRIGFKKNIFKSYITGLSETVSPSWSSNNFIGNPYKYYIYESIERSVTFTLNIVAESAEELARNWEKLSHLTKAAYPLIPYQEGDEKISSNIVSPPFIKFTLGDMYRERFGVLDSLSYTVPDTSPWETDIDGFVLPKFIDASITIKFAEDVVSGNVDKLYDFKKGGENGFLTNPIN
jgi:hypothetical protein